MQVFSEPNEIQMPPDHQPQSNSITQNLLSLEPPSSLLLDSPYDMTHDGGDNTYATIQPRNFTNNNHSSNNNNLISTTSNSSNLFDADYATLRNNRVPSVSAKIETVV